MKKRARRACHPMRLTTPATCICFAILNTLAAFPVAAQETLPRQQALTPEDPPPLPPPPTAPPPVQPAATAPSREAPATVPESDTCVVEDPAAKPVQKKSQASAYLGLTGMGGIGVPTSASSGVQLDLDFRTDELSFVLQGRAGGIGNASNMLSYASIGGGLRYFLSDADSAPFVGGGASLAYFQADQADGANYPGSGLAGYAEVGMVFLRSNHASALVALRAELPAFSLIQGANESGQGGGTNTYVVPFSINMGFLLH